jgi:TIGR03009 family protein
VAALLSSTTLATGVALAQNQAGNTKLGQRAQPAPAGPKAPAAPQAGEAPVEDRRLTILLTNWEQKSASIKSLHGKHVRSRANSVFATDSRATGKFYFEAPDKGRIDLKGTEPAKGAVSSLQTKQGEPYKLTADRDEKWVCDGKQVLVINDADKQFESIEIPKEMQGKNIVESPLPFLFGMKVVEMKKRFQMELISYDAETRIAKLTAIPLQQRDAQNFIRAEILLDTKRYLPTFVALTDPAGTMVTRYIFQDVEIDDNNALNALAGMFGRDPFVPNLRGYQKVQAPLQQAGGPAPNGAGGKVNQAGAKASPPVVPNRPTNGTAPRTTFQTQGTGTSNTTRPAPR